jgi:hypothetical protein
MAEPGYTLSSSGIGYPRETPTICSAIAKITKWMAHCVSNHPRCTLVNDFVPTRLVELDEYRSDVVIISSPAAPVKWLALSYCWGSSTQSSTTKSNIKTRKQYLTVAELPKTLQDAIKVTRDLGYKFIWIDSMCILQDDASDWATESSKMADVYSKAQLVLAATSALDCNAGFLHPKHEPLAIDVKNLNKKTHRIRAMRNDTHRCRSNTVNTDQQPLYRRAW